MKNLNNKAINSFIIEVKLVSPIEKILKQLNDGEFRDCDINWLDNKLECFVEFAAKTLNVNGVMPQRESVKPAHMNDYAVKYYNNYFCKLLSYFKNL
jgi:hypothetical protein